MERLKLSKMIIVERVALGAAALIWVGALLMAVGLGMAYLNVRAEQQAVAQAEEFSFVVVNTATSTASPTVTPSPTSTQTPMPTHTLRPHTATPDYVATYIWLKDATVFPFGGEPTATPTLTPTPTFVPTSTPTPIPTPTPGRFVAANAPPDRIVIPAIGLDAPVVPVGWTIAEQNGQRVSVWESPDFAAGWHNTSVYPGHSGNVVLNGHNNIRGEVFRYLIDLEPKAHILLYVGDQVYHYFVAEKHLLKEREESPEVRFQNAQWIAPTEDERLTLVTCWPYTSNTHRLIIVAKPYEPERPLPQ